MIGLCLAQYRIDTELGRGGMGIVYRATDTKLDRTVALKVLPAAALASADDRVRFFREAKAAAQLSHPNVCHVYQVDEAVPYQEGSEPPPGSEKRPFIAMEYIEGDTLEARIGRNPLKLTEAVSIAAQVAEALKAAHAKEIVHRDIKSANVMLTADGVAKVLDFGLAKTQASTMLTRQGSTLGTVAYMSPEQARGQEVDGRTDLYSLGTVLYEMVAGRRPFAGDYEQAVVYGILNENPEPLTALRTGVPMQLEWIVDKLLSKDADYRYQTAADLLADLKSLDVTGSGTSRRSMAAVSTARQAPAAPSRPTWIGPALLVAVLIAGGVAGWFLRPQAPAVPRPPMSVRIDLPEETAIDVPTLSPDGRMALFTAAGGMQRKMVLMDLATGEKTDIVDPAASPGLGRFSPSGRWIAYERQSAGIGIVRVPGGTPADLVEAGTNPTWLDEETILFNLDGSLARVDRIAGDVQTLIQGEDGVRTLGTISPGSEPGEVLISFFDGRRSTMAVYDIDSDDLTMLGPGNGPRLVGTSHLVFMDPEQRDWSTMAAVMAQAYDADAKKLLGPAIQVLPEELYWQFDVSPQGTLVRLVAAPQSSSGQLYRVDWRNDERFEIDQLASAGQYAQIGLSRNGEWLAHTEQAFDARLWVRSVSDPDATPMLIPTSAYNASPFVTADGDYVYYSSGSAEEFWIYRQPTDGTATAERAYPEADALLHDISADGRYLLITKKNDFATGTLHDLWWVDTRDGSEVAVDTSTAFSITDATFSPDGRLVAMETTDYDGRTIRVMGIDGSGPWIVEREGRTPRWDPRGDALFVRVGERIERVPLDFSRGVRAARDPDEVYRSQDHLIGYAVYPDGSLLVVEAVSDGQAEAGLRLFLNWDERLKAIVPID